MPPASLQLPEKREMRPCTVRVSCQHSAKEHPRHLSLLFYSVLFTDTLIRDNYPSSPLRLGELVEPRQVGGLYADDGEDVVELARREPFNRDVGASP